MKILMLADAASVHTVKWANALCERGVEVYIFGLSGFDQSLYDKNIRIESLNTSLNIKSRTDGSMLKIVYLRTVNRIKKIVRIYKPDILHSHYASSFGLLGALVNFHPYIISVWGSDIFNFPERSFIHKKIIKYSLSKADKILSTSNFMALQIKKYTKKSIEITPFGIDTDKFIPMKTKSLINDNENVIVIGTIKTLEKKYGIEYLIRAFKMVKEKLPFFKLKLLIVGGGSLAKYLKNLSKELNIQDDVLFTGFISPTEIPKYHNMIDIYAAFSIEESFGVAVLEASACSKPVVVSNVGGLPEVVENEKTGFIVEKENPAALADILKKLILDRELRIKIGRNGRDKVLREYNWNDSVAKMMEIYKNVKRIQGTLIRKNNGN